MTAINRRQMLHGKHNSKRYDSLKKGNPIGWSIYAVNVKNLYIVLTVNLGYSGPCLHFQEWGLARNLDYYLSSNDSLNPFGWLQWWGHERGWRQWRVAFDTERFQHKTSARQTWAYWIEAERLTPLLTAANFVFAYFTFPVCPAFWHLRCQNSNKIGVSLGFCCWLLSSECQRNRIGNLYELNPRFFRH